MMMERMETYQLWNSASRHHSQTWFGQGREGCPARTSAPCSCVRLRGGFEPTIFTGIVVGFLLARLLAGLPPPPGGGEEESSRKHRHLETQHKLLSPKPKESAEQWQRHPFFAELERTRNSASGGRQGGRQGTGAEKGRAGIVPIGTMNDVKMVSTGCRIRFYTLHAKQVCLSS